MQTAYIALGSNVGDRHRALQNSLTALSETPEIELIRVSNFLENPAIGGPPGAPLFLNAAAEIRTMHTPQALLQKLLQIERALGRVRREKWAPRTIDLDILLFADQIISTDHLTIPHPLMHLRRFVLAPLSEIAPEAVHPSLKKTVAELLKLLDA